VIQLRQGVGYLVRALRFGAGVGLSPLLCDILFEVEKLKDDELATPQYKKQRPVLESNKA
jgi:hypothetical protein